MSKLLRHQYPELLKSLAELPDQDIKPTWRTLCRTDLWFLLRYVMNRSDLEANPKIGAWLFERVRDVESHPNGRLFLWARGHYKSTVITFAKTIQDILITHGDDGTGEQTYAIFSHTRPIAKSFLRQIRMELTFNTTLKEMFPDILYETPERESPKWGDDDGIVVRRRGNPKESTVEAWGLVDSQPTSKHFNVLIFDDVVTQQSVATPDMIKKTTEAWELALNLGSLHTIRRYIGTRYHFNDTWSVILKRGSVIADLHAATHDGTPAGVPVMLSVEQFAEKWREMGPYTGSAQLLLNPLADETQGFKREWLRWYDDPEQSNHMNRYLLVDPAHSKKRSSDYTAAVVWGLGADQNLYILDVVRDRLNLQERAAMVMRLHQKWRPKLVGYERYGLQSDVDYLKEVQARENYRFELVEVAGPQSKTDRIRRLIPYWSEKRVYLPRRIPYTQYDGKTVELISDFIEQELLSFPVSMHDDVLDAAARLFDIGYVWPRIRGELGDRWNIQQRRHSAWGV